MTLVRYLPRSSLILGSRVLRISCVSPFPSTVIKRFGIRLTRKRALSSSASNLDSDYAAGSSISNSSRVVDVTNLAEHMRKEVRQYTARCKDPVRLAGILAADAMSEDGVESAQVYSDSIAHTLREDGIEYEHVECRGNMPQDVEASIQEMNFRSDIHGILVYYPIFREKLLKGEHGPYLDSSTGVYYKGYDDYLRDVVLPQKDVEGLNHNYISRYHFRARGVSQHRKQGEIYVPCTALSVASILEAYHPLPHDNDNSHRYKPKMPWMNTTATIINRSEIMGRPLAAMLALRGASVFSVDKDSILHFRNGGKMRRCTDPHVTLDWCLQQSSIVVTGVPKPDFQLPLDRIKADAATIVNVSEFENVCEEDVFERPGITYVPRVGKVTVAALEQNLISLHKNRIRETES